MSSFPTHPHPPNYVSSVKTYPWSPSPLRDVSLIINSERSPLVCLPSLLFHFLLQPLPPFSRSQTKIWPPNHFFPTVNPALRLFSHSSRSPTNFFADVLRSTLYPREVSVSSSPLRPQCTLSTGPTRSTPSPPSGSRTEECDLPPRYITHSFVPPTPTHSPPFVWRSSLIPFKTSGSGSEMIKIII